MVQESIVSRLHRTGIVFGLLAALPTLETFLYDIHVGNGVRSLSLYTYLVVSLLMVLLAGLMIIAFILPSGSLQPVLEPFLKWLRRIRRHLRRQIAYVLLLLPVLFLVLFFGGKGILNVVLNIGVSTVLLPFLQLGAVVFLIWIIGRVLKLVAREYKDLSAALDGWNFSIKLSAAFYLILVAATIKMMTLDGIKEGARIEFTLGIAKDYLLLFILSMMLFAGLYKVGSAERLSDLFQSQRGFLHFVLICGVIAILAIWADFNGLQIQRQSRVFRFPWQHQYNIVHVYVRDILLLLMPIAGLLVWCLLRVGREFRSKTAGTQDDATKNAG